uniref:Uncharacterized protein n=1 Tax=Trypanosoma congolense (strain IL3000) TaxID=1068625 RepID=G0UL62_TRYCI|nr:hypothetical protein, unlikely [Trypanosoma congolense IL3000]
MHRHAQTNVRDNITNTITCCPYYFFSFQVALFAFVTNGEYFPFTHMHIFSHHHPQRCNRLPRGHRRYFGLLARTGKEKQKNKKYSRKQLPAQLPVCRIALCLIITIHLFSYVEWDE